jgi:acyl-CoA thioesterase-1
MGRGMTELLGLSVMIMAVKAKWIGAVLLSLTLCACGGKKPEPPASAPASGGTEATVAPPDQRPVIVAFGDSLTAGYGVEPGKSYPDDLQRLLDAAGYMYHVVNLGVSGDTTTDGVQRLPDVLSAKPAIVILEFGGNDGLRGLPVSATRANQTQMIRTLRGAGIEVLLAGMTLPRNYGPDYIRSFEQVYVDLAAQFRLVRIPFLLEGVGGHPDLVQADGIHPTAEGCQVVSGNVMKYLRPFLKK